MEQHQQIEVIELRALFIQMLIERRAVHVSYLGAFYVCLSESYLTFSTT